MDNARNWVVSDQQMGTDPPPTTKPQLTQLLQDWARGDPRAHEASAAVIYTELRRLAQQHMRRERPDHTLQATALVHEAYIRLVDQRTQWKSRAHFFAVAASMMRRILVDHAKEHLAQKRGAGVPKASLDEALTVSAQPIAELVALNDALTELEKIDPQRSRIVELRYFAGLSNEESARVLGISPATVQRQWAGARAWLYHQLSQAEQRG
jgi:RNA polymerase sigma factor (TIGR02999 family)